VGRLRVGVIYGGRSSEHEVSLASAAAVLANLDPTRYEPIPILIDKRGRWSIADRPPTAMSAAEVIQHATRTPPDAGAAVRTTHLLADPTDETLVTIQPTGVAAGTDGTRVVPAFPVEAIDTTGAGDAFIGSFATFLAEGRSEDDALERASLYAALSTTRVGTQTSFLDRAAFEKERENAPRGS